MPVISLSVNHSYMNLKVSFILHPVFGSLIFELIQPDTIFLIKFSNVFASVT